MVRKRAEMLHAGLHCIDRISKLRGHVNLFYYLQDPEDLDSEDLDSEDLDPQDLDPDDLDPDDLDPNDPEDLDPEDPEPKHRRCVTTAIALRNLRDDINATPLGGPMTTKTKVPRIPHENKKRKENMMQTCRWVPLGERPPGT